MKNSLKQAVFKKLESNSAACAFISNLMDDAAVYLFGGAIRDFIDNDLCSSRDLDFVVEGRQNRTLDIVEYLQDFKDISYLKNRYDGYKIFFSNNITIDIWNLNDTWAFRTNKLYPSAENLMKSVYLNVDALVYSLNSENFLNNCDVEYLEIKKKRMLDIVFDETPYEDLNLLRALVFCRKYTLDLSEELNNKLISYMDNHYNNAIDNFIELQMSHYSTVLLEREDLNHILQNIY